MHTSLKTRLAFALIATCAFVPHSRVTGQTCPPAQYVIYALKPGLDLRIKFSPGVAFKDSNGVLTGDITAASTKSAYLQGMQMWADVPGVAGSVSENSSNSNWLVQTAYPGSGAVLEYNHNGQSRTLICALPPGSVAYAVTCPDWEDRGAHDPRVVVAGITLINAQGIYSDQGQLIPVPT